MELPVVQLPVMELACHGNHKSCHSEERSDEESAVCRRLQTADSWRRSE
jgi:hypothetical protein